MERHLLNRHGRDIIYNRRRYWICKRLQINIYENKKVCCNWVRRILMTEVGYDIIKTFRTLNYWRRKAHHEYELQWKLKSRIKKQGVFNFFRSKIRRQILINMPTDDLFEKRFTLLNDINRNKLYRIRSDELYSLYKKTDKEILRCKSKYKFFKEIVSKYKNYTTLFTNLSFNFKTFRVRSFNWKNAMWEVGNPISLHKWYTTHGKYYGKNRGYISNMYPDGNLKYSKGYLSKFFLSNLLTRIKWRYLLLIILIDIYYNRVRVQNLYVFLITIDKNFVIHNKSCVSLIISLINKFTLNRLLHVISILRKLNTYDISSIVVNLKYSNFTFVGNLLRRMKRKSLMFEYRNFFCESKNLSWYLKWIYSSSRVGMYELVQQLQSIYHCILSNRRLDDYNLIYEKNLNSNILWCGSRINIGRHFIKWYYLYLIRDKYLLQRNWIYPYLENQRRRLMRFLYVLKYNELNTSDNLGLFTWQIMHDSLCKYNIIDNVSVISNNTYANSVSYRIRTTNYKNTLYNKNNLRDMPMFKKYISFIGNKTYNIKVAKFSPQFIDYYNRIFFIFNEIRVTYIKYKSFRYGYIGDSLYLHDTYRFTSSEHIKFLLGMDDVEDSYQYKSKVGLYGIENYRYNFQRSYNYIGNVSIIFLLEKNYQNMLKLYNYKNTSSISVFLYMQKKYRNIFYNYIANKYHRHLFLNKYFEENFISSNIITILKHILDVKNMELNQYDIHQEYQYYHYLEEKKKRKKPVSYVSGTIIKIDEKYLALPNLNIIYYGVWYMFLYSFIYKLKYNINGNSSLLSWFIYIKDFILIYEKFLKQFKEYDFKKERKLNYPGDELWFNRNIFHFIYSYNQSWQTFRKASIYNKYDEYFFFVFSFCFNPIHRYTRHHLKGIYNLYKYGYDRGSKIFTKYTLLKRQVSYLCIIKKLIYRKLKFSVLSHYKSLEYWYEVNEKVSLGGVNSYNNYYNYYNQLIRGQILHDERYFLESKKYYSRIVPINQLQKEYALWIQGKFNREGFKKKIYLLDHYSNVLDYNYKIERTFRDSRDFFNPNIELGLITSKIYNGYMETRAYYLFSMLKHYTPQFSDLASNDVYGSKCLNVNNLYSNLYFWNDTTLFDSILSYNNYDITSTYYHWFKNRETSNMFNLTIFYEMLSELYYGIFNYSILMNEVDSGIPKIFHSLRSNILLSISYYARSNIIFHDLKNSFNINSNNISLTRATYFNIIMFGRDLIFNNSWLYSLIKSELVVIYKIYITKYLISKYMYSKFYQSTKVSLQLYKFNTTNFIKFISSSSIYMEERLFYINKHIIRLYYQYLNSIVMLNDWLKYWHLFFENRYYSGHIDFIKLINIISDSSTYYSSDSSYFSEIMYTDLLYDKHYKFHFYRERLWLYKNLYSSVNYYYTSKIYIHNKINQFSIGWYKSIFNNSEYLVFKLLTLIDSVIVILSDHLKIYSTLYSTLFFLIFYNSYIDKVRYIYRTISIYSWLINNSENSLGQFIFKIADMIKISYISNYISSTLKLQKHLRYYRKMKINSYKKIKLESIHRININLFSLRNKYMYNYARALNISSVYHMKKFYNVYLFYILGRITKFTGKILYGKLNINKNIKYSIVTYKDRAFMNFISNIGRLINYKASINTTSLVFNESEYTDTVAYNEYLLDSGLARLQLPIEGMKFGIEDYFAMYEPGAFNIRQDNLYVWLFLHRLVQINVRYYYSKFWYRYVPEDILNIQRYRRFQQEIRRLIGNRKKLRSGIIYRRLLLFKLVPGELKDWNKLHVKRPYIREQFEDRVRFFYILKYKYKISRKKLLKALYNRFSSPYTLYRAYHLLFFRLDNILYKLSFIPTFTYLRDNWKTHFWNISINTLSDSTLIQRSLRLGDIFYIRDNLHLCATEYRLEIHYEANFYLLFLLWFRLNCREGLPTYSALPSSDTHSYMLKSYIWYWYRFFKSRYRRSFLQIRLDYIEMKLKIYGFWAHNFILYKQFKHYMIINSMDNYVRWYASCMCGFVYKEPVGFLNGLHYSAYYRSESGSYGGHLKFTNIYK